MDRRTLEQLLAEGETLRVEFKAEANDDDLIEAVVCMANGGGGVVLVGVGDDGAVIGAEPRHPGGTDPPRLEALLANRTVPPASVTVSVIDIDGDDVLALEVRKPDSVIATTSGRYTRRTIKVDGTPECIPLLPHEVITRAAALGGMDVSARNLERATLNDLDPAEVQTYRDLAETSGDRLLSQLSLPDLLGALELVDHDGGLRLAAILLFGREEAIAQYAPTHSVRFRVLEGLQVRVDRRWACSLPRLLYELHAAVEPYNPEDEVEVGLLRVGLPRYASGSLRELFANALVHRDYAVNADIVVAVEDGTLSISNPGGFPEGIRLDNLLTAPPQARNRLLADAFKRAGLVERVGRGINRVFREQIALGRSGPDYARSTPDRVEVRLLAGPADRELATYVAELERDGQPLDLNDLLILHELRVEGRVTSREMAEVLQVGQPEARAALQRMVERGLVERRGNQRGSAYHLSGALYRRLGRPQAYVRTRGFDTIQHEQMVETYVREHGSISRSEAAELCQIEPRAATALLTRLRNEGRLIMRGDRRQARYYPPGEQTE